MRCISNVQICRARNNLERRTHDNSKGNKKSNYLFIFAPNFHHFPRKRKNIVEPRASRGKEVEIKRNEIIKVKNVQLSEASLALLVTSFGNSLPLLPNSQSCAWVAMQIGIQDPRSICLCSISRLRVTFHHGIWNEKEFLVGSPPNILVSVIQLVIGSIPKLRIDNTQSIRYQSTRYKTSKFQISLGMTRQLSCGKAPCRAKSCYTKRRINAKLVIRFQNQLKIN